MENILWHNATSWLFHECFFPLSLLRVGVNNLFVEQALRTNKMAIVWEYQGYEYEEKTGS